MTSPAIIACPQCDLLYRIPEVPDGGAARCFRCDAVLVRRIRNSTERTLAMAVTALILFMVANVFPFLTFQMGRDFTETTLLSGVAELWHQEMPLVAALVLMTTIVGPLLHLLVLIYLLAPLRIGRRAWGAQIVFRWFRRIVPWSMLEVFLLGVLVSMVRLADMAEIIPGIALWSFGLLIPAIAATTATLDQHSLWKTLATSRGTPAEVSR
jgi:paraquat-inducible protein A